ncbi:hypothetical protein GUITHDRAFT_152542 [Guillardia theta CCMP2712]|uniref:Uncharacterized protein n=1 Tax=Guillardia theta (strain CCMP2712) TaxID=905079 RepID=L1JCV4_GUITC|nr:hypothetical protein GUITHDRAFT_152542 [Guillardia theta CCMP2712]EKX46147.1 hypothetical protein GUITHDRAFT_152542 [Guillardia theta CCMP2712]|eukprot:XP_005833127.1 hypothetical protein GUITHDRAFT_152542 [Guillardia theta CCMP2712]
MTCLVIASSLRVAAAPPAPSLRTSSTSKEPQEKRRSSPHKLESDIDGNKTLNWGTAYRRLPIPTSSFLLRPHGIFKSVREDVRGRERHEDGGSSLREMWRALKTLVGTGLNSIEVWRFLFLAIVLRIYNGTWTVFLMLSSSFLLVQSYAATFTHELPHRHSRQHHGSRHSEHAGARSTSSPRSPLHSPPHSPLRSSMPPPVAVSSLVESQISCEDASSPPISSPMEERGRNDEGGKEDGDVFSRCSSEGGSGNKGQSPVVDAFQLAYEDMKGGLGSRFLGSSWTFALFYSFVSRVKDGQSSAAIPDLRVKLQAAVKGKDSLLKDLVESKEFSQEVLDEQVVLDFCRRWLEILTEMEQSIKKRRYEFRHVSSLGTATYTTSGASRFWARAVRKGSVTRNGSGNSDADDCSSSRSPTRSPVLRNHDAIGRYFGGEGGSSYNKRMGMEEMTVNEAEAYLEMMEDKRRARGLSLE